MKLEKRDVAEALGLEFFGVYKYNKLPHYYFKFHDKEFRFEKWTEHVEIPWEEAANKVLEPLVELLKSKLTA